MLQLISILLIGYVIGYMLWKPLRERMIIEKIKEMDD